MTPVLFGVLPSTLIFLDKINIRSRGRLDRLFRCVGLVTSEKGGYHCTYVQLKERREALLLISIDFRSLVPFRLSASDDEDLRWYFSHTPIQAEESDPGRAKVIKRILDHMRNSFNLRHSYGEAAFRNFYAPKDQPHCKYSMLSSLTATGFASPAAVEMYSELEGLTQPPTGDGEQALQWIIDSGRGLTYFRWILRLDQGRDVTDRERRALAFVHDYSRKVLEGMAESYGSTKGFLEREDARERREREREAREAARNAQPKPHRVSTRTHRKYGELPPEPQVIRRVGSKASW